MIDLSEIVNDPDLAQPFTIERSSSSFVLGGVSNTVTPLQAFGVITVSDPETLQMIPDADRPTGAMSFYSSTPIFESRDDQNGEGVSDFLIWRSQRFRVLKMFPYIDYGYNHAVAVRVAGK